MSDSSPLIVPDGHTSASWQERADNVIMFLDNVEQQVDRLQDVLMAAQDYFDDYVAGNQLNQQFYRFVHGVYECASTSLQKSP